MVEETEIERFAVPTLEQLKDLRSNSVGDEELAKVRDVLQRWHDDRDFSHEDALQACDEILGTCGVEAIDPEGAPSYTDEGIRMCPPFSYCNAGDPYVATLLRDHASGLWLVAGWGEALEEVERDEELGDYEVFDSCPDYCPSCHRKAFTLEFFPGSGRGASYSWVCDSCNHHCFAQSAEEEVPIGEDEDGHTVCVVARKPNGMPWRFEVRLEGMDAPCPDFLPAIRTFGHHFDSPEDARERFHAVMAHRAELDDEEGMGDVEDTDDEEGMGDVENTKD